MSYSKITVRMDDTDKAQLELSDPFFSETNLARLEKSKRQIAEGNIIYKTDRELGLDDDV